MTLWFSQVAPAQSGRHRNKSVSAPQPPVIVEPATNPQTVKPPAQVSSVIVAGEIVHNYDYFHSDYLDAAVEEFRHRIKQRPLPAIEVIKGGSMSLNAAKERAKKETTAYLLWIEFVTEDDGSYGMSISFINYVVLMPQTAKFLTWGKIYPDQEGIRSAGRVLRVPSPSLRRRPSALRQMIYGAREVAERLIAGGWF
ncbi:MAG TPA: hypothetical protein VGO91_09495 [Pyrinomonadaceae bacterium]|nr:hypothetical protein [Pyrinomonadaceae bacterium]